MLKYIQFDLQKSLGQALHFCFIYFFPFFSLMGEASIAFRSSEKQRQFFFPSLIWLRRTVSAIHCSQKRTLIKKKR